MSSVIPFAFNAVELYVVTINGKLWTRAKEVYRALEYNKKTTDLINAFRSRENYDQKHRLILFSTAGNFMDWPRDSSQQPKAKDFRRHCYNVLLTQIRRQLTTKMKEEHQQSITGRDNQIQALEFTNEEHQQEILRPNEEINDLIANRHVTRRGYFGNVLCFVEKNSGEVH